MTRIRAFVSKEFFSELLPYNAELLKGNAFVVRACGAKPGDSSILRSKSYILFGNGLATLPLQKEALERDGGYFMWFREVTDRPGVSHWEVQSDSNQATGSEDWNLQVSCLDPGPAHERLLMLAKVSGSPGQYIYLTRL